jgi:hypothetical protein
MIGGCSIEFSTGDGGQEIEFQEVEIIAECIRRSNSKLEFQSFDHQSFQEIESRKKSQSPEKLSSHKYLRHLIS